MILLFVYILWYNVLRVLQNAMVVHMVSFTIAILPLYIIISIIKEITSTVSTYRSFTGFNRCEITKNLVNYVYNHGAFASHPDDLIEVYSVKNLLILL